MQGTFEAINSSLSNFNLVIKPRSEDHGKVVKLSAIDQIAPRDYISLCLFFPLSPQASKERIFQTICKALSNTIDDIPELACCVRKASGNDREEVELFFDSSRGAELHYKDYTSPDLGALWTFGTFQQLEEEHFPLKMPRRMVFGTSAKLVGAVTLPVLVVQCNFIPGGLILGSCLHHVAGDGICNLIWHKTLGAHLTALAAGLDNGADCPITTLDREAVVEGDDGVTLEAMPNWKLAESSASFLNPTVYTPSEVADFENAIYYISADNLALLKYHISSGNPDVRFGTTVSLSAFLWRHVLLARNIDPREYPETRLSITIDARERMKGPSVPSNYWGNFSEPNAVAKITVTGLKGQHLPFASAEHRSDIYLEPARRIKRAITMVDDTAVRRLVGLLNHMPKSTTLTWNVNRYPGPDMLIVCIQTHTFNDIYFGKELNYPSAMRCTIGDTEGKPDGRCMILPPRRGDGGGLEVAMQYDTRTLRRLENDIEFSRFFIRRN